MPLLLISIISSILIIIGVVVYLVMFKDPIYEGLQDKIASKKADYDLIPVINLTKVPQTFSTWVKLEKPGTYQSSRTILGNNTSNTSKTNRTVWLHLLGLGTPSIYIKGIGTFVSDFKLIPNDKWYNIVWVNDIKNMKLSLYINGDKLQTWNHNIMTITPDIPKNIRIGFDASDNSLDTGAITKVSIYRNILSDEQIKDVNLFYDKYISDTKVYFDDFSELLLQNTLGSVNNNQDYHSIVNFLKTNTKIFDIASELIGYRKEKLVNPYISILHFKSFEEIKDQIDGQNTPHIDVFYPSYKFFIYLNEVNELNGAFCYLKGSHSFSISNLVKYYKNCDEFKQRNTKNKTTVNPKLI